MLDGGDEKGGGPESAGGGGEFYEGDRSTGGNRWPRQETLALLKIRSDMDTAFRDSSLKGPLWEEISRKMAELGYHRSGKKCKEKFENVYKYHKRTKEGRVAKADGKTYRFFDQLEAFDHHQHHQHHHSQPQLPPDEEAVPVTMLMPASAIPHHVTVTSTPPINIIHHYQNQQQQQQQINTNNNNNNPITNQTQQPAMPMPSSRSASATPSSSSSTDVDEEVAAGTRKRKRSRKWKGLLKRMAREVIHKQEELQRRFMEAVEKRENDRITREEAWKVQELSRLKREHDTLLHERSMAAAKDAALISFLQKIAEQRNIPFPLSLQAQAQPQAQIQIQNQAQDQVRPKTNGGTQKEAATEGARWPKAEVEALIKLRSSMDSKYEENSPKGPLWEEISAAMKKMGYNRSSKRCKEKWENINKYFKKVKESNRKRRDDSKTCPYFDHLDALYRLKNQPPTEVGRAEAHPPQESEDFEDDDEEEGDEEGGGFEIVANTTATGGGGTTAAMAAEEGGERR